MEKMAVKFLCEMWIRSFDTASAEARNNTFWATPPPQTHKPFDTYSGRFIMYSGHDVCGHVASVANATVAKHTDDHTPARRKSLPLPLWGSSLPEQSATRTLNRACVWKWPTTEAMAPDVPWHYGLWFFSLGKCQKPGIRPTIATWPRWPKGRDNCNSEEYRCTHVDACVARTWISYRCVPCHPWCVHRTSLVVKNTFSILSMAVNSSIKVGPLVFLL
jgi:hypothetical protein